MAASLPSMTVNSHRGWAWYLLITVQWLSLLTKAFRWDISAVSSCSFEKWFVNCHFELIQYWQQPGISGRPITSPVFTHPVVFESEPCPLCSETIHSSYSEFVRRHGINSWSCLAKSNTIYKPNPMLFLCVLCFMYKSCLVLKRKNLSMCFHSG